jgi:hypothetical protein
MQDYSEIKKEVQRLKTRLSAEIDKIEDVATLVKKQIEREVGLWEYDFEELEAELWKRFATLEENSDCVSEAEVFWGNKILDGFFRRLKRWYRALSGPFSRSVIDKKKQFNLDQQSRINQENIPFRLAIILSLQKIKDRLNVLEENIQKIQEDQEDLFREQYASPQKLQNKEKGSRDDKN